MNVLSLFDGMSCGKVALDRLGFTIDNYFASEIDESAIKVSKKNHPNIIHLGDIKSIQAKDLPKIDLIIGGSPCTTFSRAGDGSGFDGASGLFWEYVRLVKECNPTYFLLENVVMKKEWKDVISNALGVTPKLINSNTVSAQNRPRLYWANFDFSVIEEPCSITVKDILEDEPVDSKFYLSDKAIAYMDRLRNGKPRWEYHTNPLDGKAACLTANMYKGVPYLVIKEFKRKLTPVECERLQTLDSNYSDVVSQTARYRMIGNGWTVKVISHILSHIKQ